MQAALIASLAASAVAAPLVSRRQAAAPPAGVTDATILNYALSLEHLEATFYREALAKFSDEDFKKAGLGADFVDNLKEIAKDEATHVEFLTTGLQKAGATPAQECKYKFGYTDVQSFLATANLLEGVGVSAYLGAAQYIANADYLTAAGAILTVESRHSAYIRDNQTPKPLSPFPAPFDIPLGFNDVFSLAAPLIESCPDGKGGTLGLPFKAYPSIAVGPAGAAKPGDVLTFTVSKEVDAQKAYFITFPGGAIEADIATADNTVYQVTVPAQAQAGQAYVVLTGDDKAPSDDNTVAGPAVFEILDNAGAFQKANPDYSYDKDCEKDSYGKPEGYGKPEAPKSTYAPKSPESPKSPEAPKGHPTPAPYKPEEKPQPYSTTKSEAPKGYPTPAPYPSKPEEKPQPYSSTESKAPYYPSETKSAAPHYPTQTHAPEYKSTSTTSEYKSQPTPHAPEKKEYKDKEGHDYAVDKDGHVCVYDKEGKPYPNDKDGKPYGKDETTGQYYTVDYQGNKEPCDESYKPY